MEAFRLFPKGGNKGKKTGRKEQRHTEIRVSDDGRNQPAAAWTGSSAAAESSGNSGGSGNTGEERITSHGQPIARHVVDYASSAGPGDYRGAGGGGRTCIINDMSRDRKSTRLNSSHANISYAVFC